MDGTLAECDRVGDELADYSSKHKRHGMNVQVVTGPAGKILWLSPALPGWTHDLAAAHKHKIIRICERPGVPILADNEARPRHDQRSGRNAGRLAGA